MDDINRFRATERDCLNRLMIASWWMDEVDNDIGGRVRRLKLTRAVKMVQYWLGKLTDGLIATMPEEQKKAMVNGFKTLSYRVGVRMPNSNDRKVKEYGTWISWHQLTTFVKAMQDHCMMCDFNAETERNCELRKAFDEMCTDVEHTNGCGYREHIVLGSIDE